MHSGLTAEAEGQRFHGGSGAVFDSELQVVSFSGEIDIAVSERMEVGASAEALPRACVGSLAGVVGEDNGNGVSAFEFSQKPQEPGDFPSTVFIESVESHQGVEEEHFWLQACQGFVKANAVLLAVEAHDGGGDEVHVEGVDGNISCFCKLCNAGLDLFKSILGHEDERGSRCRNRIAPEARFSRSDGQSHFEPKPALAAFWLSSNDAASVFEPQMLDEPCRFCLGWQSAHPFGGERHHIHSMALA
jgi:hypothetical protein